MVLLPSEKDESKQNERGFRKRFGENVSLLFGSLNVL